MSSYRKFNKMYVDYLWRHYDDVIIMQFYVNCKSYISGTTIDTKFVDMSLKILYQVLKGDNFL